MTIKRIGLLCALCLLAPSVAGAVTVKYSAAQIYAVSSTVDLIPTTSGSGILSGVKCAFPNGASVKLIFTIDGTTSSFTIDPTYLERESDGAGQYLTGWIPLFSQFSSSIRVQMNNTGLGTATINCWASWQVS